MEFYNIFLNNTHNDHIKKIMTKYNYNMLRYILKETKMIKNNTITILEIGVGKGYFKDAVHMLNEKATHEVIEYYAFDRNKSILANLEIHPSRCFQGTCPSLEGLIDKKFDIIYCAFMIEHLTCGQELYIYISNLKRHLKKDGSIIFLSPDALKQKFEFYNIDYTHIYPTTKRNVSMAFYDNGFEKINIVPINGIMFYRGFYNKLLFYLHRILLYAYNYKVCSFIFSFVYKRPLWDLNNFFYRIYCFAKEENLMFIVRK